MFGKTKRLMGRSEKHGDRIKNSLKNLKHIFKIFENHHKTPYIKNLKQNENNT